MGFFVTTSKVRVRYSTRCRARRRLLWPVAVVTGAATISTRDATTSAGSCMRGVGEKPKRRGRRHAAPGGDGGARRWCFKVCCLGHPWQVFGAVAFFDFFSFLFFVGWDFVWKKTIRDPYLTVKCNQIEWLHYDRSKIRPVRRRPVLALGNFGPRSDSIPCHFLPTLAAHMPYRKKQRSPALMEFEFAPCSLHLAHGQYQLINADAYLFFSEKNFRCSIHQLLR